jgi:prevent-host-death family protein
MNTVQLRDAKARLSALVDAAERGEATTITKHGRPAAMLVPIEEGRQLHPEKKLNFGQWLLSIPYEIPYERDRTPVRDVEF